MTAVGAHMMRCPSCGASVAIGVARCSYCESLLIVESGAGRTAGVVILDFAQVRRDYSDSMNGGLTSFAAEGERIFAGSDGQLLPLNARHRIVVARDTSGAYGLIVERRTRQSSRHAIFAAAPPRTLHTRKWSVSYWAAPIIRSCLPRRGWSGVRFSTSLLRSMIAAIWKELHARWHQSRSTLKGTRSLAMRLGASTGRAERR